MPGKSLQRKTQCPSLLPERGSKPWEIFSAQLEKFERATGAIALLVAQTLSIPGRQVALANPCCYLVGTRKFSLTSRRIFSKWQLFTKTCSFYRLGLGGHSAPKQPISDQHRINQSAISIFPSLFDLMECSRMFHKDTVQHRNNQRSAFSRHFLTFDLMIFFFYSSPDSSHTLRWIVEYSGGETSTLCQLEVSVWPCV